MDGGYGRTSRLSGPSIDYVIKWTHFRVTGPLWGESTDDRWIPLTKTSDAEVWYFLYLNKPVQRTNETPVIWDAIVLIIWRHSKAETLSCLWPLLCLSWRKHVFINYQTVASLKFLIRNWIEADLSQKICNYRRPHTGTSYIMTSWQRFRINVRPNGTLIF